MGGKKSQDPMKNSTERREGEAQKKRAKRAFWSLGMTLPGGRQTAHLTCSTKLLQQQRVWTLNERRSNDEGDAVGTDLVQEKVVDGAAMASLLSTGTSTAQQAYQRWCAR